VIEVAWEQRGGKRYYYRGIREGSRVTKQYVGVGPNAVAAAEEDAAARAARAADAAAAKAEAEGLAALDQVMLDLDGRADGLAAAAMVLAGCRKHHGGWRRGRKHAH
jgi:hypothetical protein